MFKHTINNLSFSMNDIYVVLMCKSVKYGAATDLKN